MKKTLWFEPETKEDETRKWQKLYDYAMKENWEGQLNDIIDYCDKHNIKLK